MYELQCSCGRRVTVGKAQVGKAFACPACRAALRLLITGAGGTAATPQAKLVIRQGPARVGEQVFLAGNAPVEVGKLPGSDLQLTGERVSRTHCRLTPTPDGWRIDDLASTNGLFVNGRRVGAARLRLGDKVRIGEYELEWASPEPAPSQSAGAAARPDAPGGSVPSRADEPTPAAAHSAKSAEPAGDDEGIYAIAGDQYGDWDDLQALASGGEAVASPQSAADVASARGLAAPAAASGPGPVCPSCEKQLPAGARLCVACGINLKTGRSILTAEDTNLNETYVTAEGVIRLLSWIIPTGLYPFASEAFGTRKPHSTRAIAAVTVAISIWFLVPYWTGSPGTRDTKDLMLWVGDKEPTGRDLAMFYSDSTLGDADAFWAKVKELAEASVAPDPAEPPRAEELVVPDEQERANEGDASRPEEAVVSDNESDAAPDSRESPHQGDDAGTDGGNARGVEELLEDEQAASLLIAAHQSLPPDKQYAAPYATSQLLTHAFLHGGIMHLLGNLLFLLVFGSRVNALVGNVLTVLLYPILAIGSALISMAAEAAGPPTPSLGASGAIMGLAGMYLVLFPLHNMHMAAWMRWGLFRGFHLSLKMWAVRGFWVVLFYIAFDVIFTAFGIEDGTAHWAHLGGFIVGVALALALLCARLINARGGDVLSVLLGRFAWALVGRPNREKTILQRLP